MTLSRTQIAEVAHMARLRLTEDELDKYTDINKILDLAEQISEINTTNITPMAHPLNLYQRLREDTVTEPNLRDMLQTIATCVELGLYLVPQVIE
ncbi:MAG: Asp-tRNA(Asn)/Glu-tRNA(Gln) amidotransferase subunit GatC [Gammaproteobacteria bacterium]|jgi:aspartyl-tRNA(Asn)/glutamyl-tRNA(Gln) amidotransferase subunit C